MPKARTIALLGHNQWNQRIVRVKTRATKPPMEPRMNWLTEQFEERMAQWNLILTLQVTHIIIYSSLKPEWILMSSLSLRKSLQ